MWDSGLPCDDGQEDNTAGHGQADDDKGKLFHGPFSSLPANWGN
jgi:hypothetical protein